MDAKEALFKSSEEIQEFFKTIFLEYKFNCQYEKDPEGCTLLGNFYETVKEDYKQAFNIYKMTCDKYKYAKSCNQLGQAYYLGRGTAKNLQNAFDTWLKSCYEGTGRDTGIACYNGGQMILDDNENCLVKDPKKGLEMLEKACDQKVVNGCSIAANYLLTKERYQEALKFLKSACDLFDHPCCYNLYILYSKGLGTEKNPTLAKEYKEKFDKIKAELEGPGIEFGQYI